LFIDIILNIFIPFNLFTLCFNFLRSLIIQILLSLSSILTLVTMLKWWYSHQWKLSLLIQQPTIELFLNNFCTNLCFLLMFLYDSKLLCLNNDIWILVSISLYTTQPYYTILVILSYYDHFSLNNIFSWR
jgi:hypothetical protein